MIRPFQQKDKNRLIELLCLNVPRYFDASEVKEFIDYLDNRLEHYFVIEDNDTVIGSGGINYFVKDRVARISWDIIHPSQHGKGYGTLLLLFRINEIKKNRDIHLIVVRTSQVVYQFYQKSGFNVVKIEKDFWAKGFDLYQMELSVNQ